MDKAIKKIEYCDTIDEWHGYITNIEFLRLHDLGFRLVHMHESIVNSAKEQKRTGEVFSSWYYFTKPNKKLLGLLPKMKKKHQQNTQAIKEIPPN